MFLFGYIWTICHAWSCMYQMNYLLSRSVHLWQWSFLSNERFCTKLQHQKTGVLLHWNLGKYFMVANQHANKVVLEDPTWKSASPNASPVCGILGVLQQRLWNIVTLREIHCPKDESICVHLFYKGIHWLHPTCSTLPWMLCRRNNMLRAASIGHANAMYPNLQGCYSWDLTIEQHRATKEFPQFPTTKNQEWLWGKQTYKAFSSGLKVSLDSVIFGCHQFCIYSWPTFCETTWNKTCFTLE